MSFEYKFGVLGGTFDRLHDGHKKLLELGFEVAENVVIGVTSDGFVVKKALSELILPYSDRLGELENYLKEQGFEGRYEIVEIGDVFGTTLEDERFEVLVVSEETKKGAELVNDERKKKGLVKLPVRVAQLALDETGERISSERIRLGLVSRSGVVYAKAFEKVVKMSDEQRRVLAEPMDAMLVSREGLDQYTKVAIVGDRSLAVFEEEGLAYDHAVYDMMVERARFEGSHKPVESELVAVNQPGEISPEASMAVAKMIKEGVKRLRVEGEEDLLALPMILELPLNSMVIYGQPKNGMVGVQVTEESKEKWYGFLRGEW